MVYIVCIFCKTKNAYKWPSNPKIAKQWNEFASRSGYRKQISTSSGICYKHFVQSDFTNYEEWTKKSLEGKNSR